MYKDKSGSRLVTAHGRHEKSFAKVISIQWLASFLCPLLTLKPVSSCRWFSMLADKLNMSPEEAERWIVNLIRNARLDAKIDSKLVRRCKAAFHKVQSCAMCDVYPSSSFLI